MDEKTDPRVPFRSMTVDGFLSALASDAPSPGGGAAAGLLGAKACALAEMACRLTLSNKKYEAVHEKAAAWLTIFGEARGILLDLADEDAENFDALMAAYRTPREAEGRAETLGAATEKAMEAPLAMGQTLADLMPLFTALVQEGNKNLITDSLIAAECAMAAIHASELNVRINLKAVKNEFVVRETEETLRRWADAVSAADAVFTYQVSL